MISGKNKVCKKKLLACAVTSAISAFASNAIASNAIADTTSLAAMNRSAINISSTHNSNKKLNDADVITVTAPLYSPLVVVTSP
ncbi:putative membrane receptor domain protein, partial [Yersinia pestis PY-02]